jgi:hypothetical protein
MSALSLPESIHRHIKEIAQKEGMSINHFISAALMSFFLHSRHMGRSLDYWQLTLCFRCVIRINIFFLS